MKTIGTLGEILVEIMALDRGNGFTEPLRLSGPYPSGAPAIFIDQVGRLGQPCGLVSCVGDDDFGRLNLDRLARDGVDTRGIAIDPDRPTGSAFVRYRPDGSRDFVFNIRHSACGQLERTDDTDRVIAGWDHLHLMGSSLSAPAVVALAEAAVAMVKGRGGTVSFDPNIRKEMLDAPGTREAFGRILSAADLFLPSGAELFLFTRSGQENAATRELLDRGIGCVVVKHGAAGASCHTGDGVVHQAAFTATEHDPTGAGDCFGATFVTCWLRGLPLDRALALAAASGALAVERQGPMEGASSMAELEAVLRGGRPVAGAPP